MQALILAAGYATRLYPLTEHQPKPLLQVGNKAIIEHILAKLEVVENINQVYVVTNAKFHQAFTDWAKSRPTRLSLKVLNDGTKNNEDRLGAVGDIHFVVEAEKVDDDFLVIAGDNLFGFSLVEFVDAFHAKKSSMVAFHDMKDIEKVRSKYGVGILKGEKVIDFEEKPAEPKSSLASTACYLFKKKDLAHLKTVVAQKADAPGNLIRYLAQHSEVHGFVFDEHWFDVGSFESLAEAKRMYEGKEYKR